MREEHAVQPLPQGLWVVATPIGNLDDMPPRAVQVLRQVDAIAAEDTRRSGRLLAHFGIDTPLLAYHDHNEQRVAGRLVQRMQAGQRLALISDAGTPLVSDPGYRLVALAREAGLPVRTVPGPSAAVAALSISGLPVDRFCFLGFPPARGEARRRWFQDCARAAGTVVFYESSHRIEDALDLLRQLRGETQPLFLARELTKLHETSVLAPVADHLRRLQQDPQQRKGEFVLVLPALPRQSALSDGDRRWLEALSGQLSPSQLARVGAAVTGMDRQALYRWLSENGSDC